MSRQRRSARTSAAFALTAVAALVAGCGPSADAGSSGPAGVGGTVTVFAAASLTEPFTEIGEAFEAAHPGTTVVFNFGASSTLAQQLNEGAPADVFAAADPVSMGLVGDVDPDRVDPEIFVRNQLVIAVAAGNPRGIGSLSDLATPGVTVALCAEQVPCGRAAVAALAAGGVQVTPVTLERDVRAALAKVNLGEVDAALVYRTDAQSASDVEGIEFPESEAAANEYPITVLADAPNPATAAALVAYVRSADGMAVLREAGFQAS